MNTTLRIWTVLVSLCVIVLFTACNEAHTQSINITASCSPENFISGVVLTSKTFQLDFNKQEQESLNFQTSMNQDLCVLIKTGLEDSKEKLIVPAPKTISITLDEKLKIAGPIEFNTEPQTIWRAIDSSMLKSESHVLTVEAQEKDSNISGVVYMAVIATASNTSTDSSTNIPNERLENLHAAHTVVKDEILVTAPELDITEIRAFTQSLPFDAFVIEKQGKTSLYRVLLPGVNGGQMLRDRVAEINAKLSSGHATLNYVEIMVPY